MDGTSRDDVFVAHYGNNWEEGNWGIIDNRGNWITDHTFEDIDNTEFYGDMFVFCKEDEEIGDYLFGIYDMKQNKVIVEPIYDTICRVASPLITVRIGKKNYHGRSNCKEGLMSKDGTLVLPVEYKDICCYQDNYITACRDGYCEMLYYIEK